MWLPHRPGELSTLLQVGSPATARAAGAKQHHGGLQDLSGRVLVEAHRLTAFCFADDTRGPSPHPSMFATAGGVKVSLQHLRVHPASPTLVSGAWQNWESAMPDMPKPGPRCQCVFQKLTNTLGPVCLLTPFERLAVHSQPFDPLVQLLRSLASTVPILLKFRSPTGSVCSSSGLLSFPNDCRVSFISFECVAPSSHIL